MFDFGNNSSLFLVEVGIIIRSFKFCQKCWESLIINHCSKNVHTKFGRSCTVLVKNACNTINIISRSSIYIL